MNLPWTQAGFPALTIPCGLDDGGLPYGLQMVGRFYEDERLLAWAEVIERSLGVTLGVADLAQGVPAAGTERGR